jgi:hypothetical protein
LSIFILIQLLGSEILMVILVGYNAVQSVESRCSFEGHRGVHPRTLHSVYLNLEILSIWLQMTFTCVFLTLSRILVRPDTRIYFTRVPLL